MKKLDYFFPRTLCFITGIVFISQLFVELSGIGTRRQGFEWVIYVCGAAFFASLLYALVAILINAWIETGGSFRTIVLWITGRDLLKPVPVVPDGTGFRIVGYDQNWELTIAPGNPPGLVIRVPTGPNFLYRWMQYVTLGFNWELIRKD